MFVTLDSSARMTIVFRAGEDLQTVVCPRTQYVTLRFNQCVPLLLIPIVLIIRTPLILERFSKGCVLGLLNSTCCWCIGYEARYLNSYWFQWVSDFIFHYIGAPGCGPIQANVRWIHYLWPPLFPLFFHRIKPRGGRRESLSIFHSTVATKILDSVKGCPEKKKRQFCK